MFWRSPSVNLALQRTHSGGVTRTANEYDRSLCMNLQEAKDPRISLENDAEGGKVSFSGKARSHAVGPEDHDYALDVRSPLRIVGLPRLRLLHSGRSCS